MFSTLKGMFPFDSKRNLLNGWHAFPDIESPRERHSILFKCLPLYENVCFHFRFLPLLFYHCFYFPTNRGDGLGEKMKILMKSTKLPEGSCGWINNRPVGCYIMLLLVHICAPNSRCFNCEFNEPSSCFIRPQTTRAETSWFNFYLADRRNWTSLVWQAIQSFLLSFVIFLCM